MTGSCFILVGLLKLLEQLQLVVGGLWVGSIGAVSNDTPFPRVLWHQLIGGDRNLRHDGVFVTHLLLKKEQVNGSKWFENVWDIFGFLLTFLLFLWICSLNPAVLSTDSRLSGDPMA